MRDEDDLPEFYCSILNIVPRCDLHKSMPPEIEAQIYLEISAQLIEYLTEALKHKDDPHKAIKVMVRADKILGAYMAKEPRPLPLLAPMKAGLEATLHIAARMARRNVIRWAMRGNEYCAREVHKVIGDDDESREDVRAAERHLAEGRRLMEGLWASKADRARFTDLGLEGLIGFLNAKAGLRKYTLGNVRAGLANDEEALQWLGYEAVGLGNA
jgi:hypothetical protein